MHGLYQNACMASLCKKTPEIIGLDFAAGFSCSAALYLLNPPFSDKIPVMTQHWHTCPSIRKCNQNCLLNMICVCLWTALLQSAAKSKVMQLFEFPKTQDRPVSIFLLHDIWPIARHYRWYQSNAGNLDSIRLLGSPYLTKRCVFLITVRKPVWIFELAMSARKRLQALPTIRKAALSCWAKWFTKKVLASLSCRPTMTCTEALASSCHTITSYHYRTCLRSGEPKHTLKSVLLKRIPLSIIKWPFHMVRVLTWKKFFSWEEHLLRNGCHESALLSILLGNVVPNLPQGEPDGIAQDMHDISRHQGNEGMVHNFEQEHELDLKSPI